MSDLYSCKIIAKNTYYEYVDLTLESSALSEQCRAGQFLHVECGGATTLRRPISVCETVENGVRIIFQIKGQGTALLAKKNVGDFVSVLGPLGNGFTVENKKTVLVGGGLGSFPLLQAAKLLGENAMVILGYRSAEAVYLKSDFEKYASQVLITTDDGTEGRKGFVTDVLQEVIGENERVLACGPDIMMKNVSKICSQHKVKCQVSLEERMGCGTGVCLCCTRPIKRGSVENLCVCKDGPVFDGEEVYY